MIPEDVLKARLKTMGVVEHTFLLSKGNQRGVEWKIYDVGGSRNQRQAWAPFFEDGDADSFIGRFFSPNDSISERGYFPSPHFGIRSSFIGGLYLYFRIMMQ